jgi:hypothetical protein
VVRDFREVLRGAAGHAAGRAAFSRVCAVAEPMREETWLRPPSAIDNAPEMQQNMIHPQKVKYHNHAPVSRVRKNDVGNRFSRKTVPDTVSAFG